MKKYRKGDLLKAYEKMSAFPVSPTTQRARELAGQYISAAKAHDPKASIILDELLDIIDLKINE